MITLGEFQSTIGLQLSYLIVFGGTLLYFLSFSFLYTLVGNLNDIFIRFKDTFALIIYSQIPLIFGLVILFTLELVIFGDYLFSINPTPLIIKGSIAFLFLALEIGVIIWSIFLVYKAFHSQSQKLSFSLTATILFFILFSTLIYFYSLFVFTI